MDLKQDLNLTAYFIRDSETVQQIIKVFPNPTEGVVNIEHFINKIDKIKVLDITGRIHFQTIFSKKDIKNTLD